MLHEFSYIAPRTRAELLGFLKQHSRKARVLAGGTDLLVDMRAGREKPDFLVDIKNIPGLGEISFDSERGLSLGGAVTSIRLIEDKTIAAKFPLLAQAAGKLGSPQLRNRATVAGNICTASPCADLGTALLALGASVEMASAERSRSIPLKDFYTGVKTTQLQPHEIVERITVPAEMAGARGGMEKLKRIKGHDLALVSVAMVRTSRLLRVAIASAAPTPLLLKDFSADVSLEEVLRIAEKSIKPISDVRASKDYRAFMVGTFIETLFRKLAD